MCLMCEQEDLYFLYLARIEQARRAARGEQAQPNPHWMWPGAAGAQAAPAPTADAAQPAPRAAEESAFVCDTPE
jgi:hypothetical protein